LKPTITMDKPNEPIEIHNGIATINYNGYVIRTDVRIYQSWFPYDQVRFIFSLNQVPAFWLDLVMRGLNKRIEIQISSYLPWTGVVHGVRQDDDEITIQGAIEKPVVTYNNAAKV